jgi:hypothetical protein
VINLPINSTNTIGFTPGTSNNLLIDAGAVYKNYGLANEALIGATSGGNEFDIKVKTRDVKVDGLKGTVKGLTRIISTDVTLKVNMLELTTDVLKMALMGVVDTVINADYDIITGKTEIALTDYIDNIAIVGRLSGSLKPVVIILKNVLSSDGIKFSNKDAVDNILPITFTASIDPNTPTVSPYEIRYPKIGALAPFYMLSAPIIDGGKIRMAFSATVAAVVPLTGFMTSVLGVVDVITEAVRDVNDLSVVVLTLTTAPTPGQAVTIAYTLPISVPDQVTSLAGGVLATFPILAVTNN